jgi:hypothetical protein
MGQSARVFAERGYSQVETWQQVSAPGRRRRCFFDGQRTLAAYIASRSDIDDLVPTLVAYQIERHKLHYLLQQPPILNLLKKLPHDKTLSAANLQQLAKLIQIPSEDLDKLSRIWQENG